MGPGSFPPPPEEPFLYMLKRHRQEREAAQRWREKHEGGGKPPDDIRHEFKRARGRTPKDGNPLCQCGKRKRHFAHFTEFQGKKGPRTMAAHDLIVFEGEEKG